MSRRKQSNPKSIKVPADPPGADSSGQDTRLEDVKQEILSDQAESSDSEMKPEISSKNGSPYSSVDSPDHIDVVNSVHSPLRSSSPSAAQALTSSSHCPSMSPESVVVKTERDLRESSCSQDNELVHAGSPQALDGQSVTQGLVRHLQLPNDVLYLKKLEVSVHGNPTVSWVVCNAIPLPKGSSLGPFSGDVIASDSIKVGDLIVQFKCNRTGHMALVNVAGHTGAWLALLRPALDPASRNTHVYLEGGRIWCEIVADIQQGMELRATFEFDLDELPVAEHGMSVAPISPSAASPSDRPLSAESPPMQQQAVSALQHASPPGHAALIYGCPFCGVRFSSPRTLQGHLSYYCSKKKSDLIVSPRPKPSPRADSPTNTSDIQELPKVKQEADSVDSLDGAGPSQQNMLRTSGSKRPATTTDNNDASDHEQSSPPPNKVPCLDSSVLQCPLCSYCADKPTSLTRHMRIHNRPAETVTSPDKLDLAGSGATARPGASPVNSSATYCKECNIQFSSYSTFRCHKEFYCSLRRTGLPLQREDTKSDGRVIGGHAPISMAQELSAASLQQLAALGQSGFVFPSAQQGIMSNRSVIAAGDSVGQAAVLVMTPSGLANMAIPLPSVLVQSIQSAAAAAAAAAMGAPVSPPHASPQKIPPSPKPSTSDTSSRVTPDEAHQNKSPKKSHPTEESAKELPLDLSTRKSDHPKPSRTSSAGEIAPPGGESVKVDMEDERSPSALSHVAPPISPAAVRSRSSASSDASIRTTSPSSISATTASLAGIPQIIPSTSLLPGFLPMHPMATAGIHSIALTGQGLSATPPGISKCTDCNIIFYKHENYLVHKKVYCSGKKHHTDRPSTPDNALSPKGQEPIDGMASDASQTRQSPHATPSPGHSSFLQVTAGDYLHPTAAAIPHLKPGLRSPGTGSEEVFYKFFCVPCKIKFSSTSNLKAHKEFYCPHGKNSEHTVIVQTQGGEIVGTSTSEQHSPTGSGSSPSPGQYSCNQCHTVFSTSRLLKLHLCSAEMTQASLLRCSHCDYVTQTDKRLSEHMKVHNPTSAYRCTLCGYRGNTVRGMRMHGKTHTDNGEEFTDHNMVEFQEPPLVPIQTNNDHKNVHGPLDIEAELIRLKNEPYKRRRSRKAFEKVDILAIPDQPLSCHICGECFNDSRTLSMHLRIHEIANQYSQGLVHCDQCDYIAKSLEDLRTHTDISHAVITREEKENHPKTVSPSRTPSSEREGTDKRATSLGKVTPVPILVKTEPIDPGFDDCRENVADISRDQCEENKLDVEGSNHHADECGESRSARKTVVETESVTSPEMPLKRSDSDSLSKGKSEGRSPVQTLQEPASVFHADEDVHTKREPITEESCEATCGASSPAKSLSSPAPAVKSPSSEPDRTSLTSPHSESTAPSRKSPLASPVPSSSTVKVESEFLPHSLPASAAGLFPYFLLPSHSTVLAPSADMASSVRGRVACKEEGGGEGEVIGPPYCKNCDISFTYLSTFIAHKKYYCTGRNNVAPSATA